MTTPIATAFGRSGGRLEYQYDFGSTTALVLSLSGPVAAQTSRSVRLVARNEAPIWPCDECGQAATAICSQCLNEGAGFTCREHTAGHPCGDEMMLPVVNSPRMGICGYVGEG